jgi:hypothetical protein
MSSDAMHSTCQNIDVMILLRQPFDFFEMALKTNPITSMLSLISQVFVTQEQFKQEHPPSTDECPSRRGDHIL